MICASLIVVCICISSLLCIGGYKVLFSFDVCLPFASGSRLIYCRLRDSCLVVQCLVICWVCRAGAVIIVVTGY